ncbi:pectinesterase inhibitor 9-like [Carex rostrata]
MKQSNSLALLLNLTLLIMVTIHATAVTPIQSNFIRSSCKATRYPDLCVQSLLTYAPSVRHSPRQLAHAALTVSLTRARSTSAFIKQQFPKPDPARSRQAGAIKDCLDTMKDGVDQLRQSVQEMGQMGRVHTRRFRWHLSNVQTWVSAALTDTNTCLDSLSHNAGPTVRTAVRKRVVEVAQVTSNALALVNRLAPHY